MSFFQFGGIFLVVISSAALGANAMKTKTILLALTASVAVTSTAWAHPGHGVTGSEGLASGFLHPWLGIDHMLAMIAVGLLAVQWGGRALWLLPVSFVGSMVVGGAFGIASWNLSFVEGGIAFSVLALGAAIAVARRFPLVVLTVAVGLFGLFHGHAHGTEAPGMMAPLLYFLGFTTGTALLHLTGIGLGLLATRSERWEQMALRLSGVAVACVGLALLLNVA